MSIYLDNAASTQLDPEVLNEMLPLFENGMGNPSSTHSEGRKLKSRIETARKEILQSLGCAKSYELVFTSGGTESNNIAIRGICKANGIKNIITTAVEHNAVLDVANDIEGIEVHLCPVDRFGRINLEILKELLETSSNTLVSIMHGNNETGALNDLMAIASMCQKKGAFFHSDTVQTIATSNWFVQDVLPDAFVASAHKFHGPKGIGFLVLKKGTKCSPIVKGGGQEKGLRSGTENAPLIIGMAKAFSIAQANVNNSNQHFAGLSHLLIARMDDSGIAYELNSDTENNIPSTINLRIQKEMDLATLLFSLDLKGIQVSGGSACSSGALKESRILKHLHGESKTPSIRVSLSKYTTEKEIEEFVNTLTTIVLK